MKLMIMPKEVYGRYLFFPGCKIGKLLCKLLKRKSFSEWQLKVLLELGYEVDEVLPKGKLKK